MAGRRVEALGKVYKDHSHGTEWRIWDLHVHTPNSITHHYGVENDDIWERFIEDLEALPAEVAVIGVNDYWFLDGYKRIIRERKRGRLQNLEAVFPVIELRLNHFGGTKSKLSRVNLHVVFDPELDPAIIEAQFIHALQPRAELSPETGKNNWSGVITRDALSDFGRKIKDSVPPEMVHQYGSDLAEGFNNLNVSLEDVQEVLDSHYFKGRTLIGIGKTEWSDIKWNEQSVAAKKNVINAADFVFTAYQDVSKWQTDVEFLKTNCVTHKVLDCSDAHYFSNSREHERIGACQTWLNTSPTFAGLAYAIEEFDRRVFVGLEPPSLKRVRRKPEHFIKHLCVQSEDEGKNLFNHNIDLNPGFIAVVGNKGQGKSALLDCIALGGNSSRNKEFTFLNPQRFLNARSKREAQSYSVELTWMSGLKRQCKLDDCFDRFHPVQVEYLPQMFVERVCNPIPGDKNKDAFEKELRAILFTHIPEQDRDGELDFDSLMLRKSEVYKTRIEDNRNQLRNTIQEYIGITAFLASNGAAEIEERLRKKQAEIDVAQEALEIAEQELSESDKLHNRNEIFDSLERAIQELDSSISSLSDEQEVIQRKQADYLWKLDRMDQLASEATALNKQVDSINRSIYELISDYSVGPYLVMTVDSVAFAGLKQQLNTEMTNLQLRLSQVVEALNQKKQQRNENEQELSAADDTRERARQRVLQLKERIELLKGSADQSESLLGLESLLQRVKNAPLQMNKLQQKILEHSHSIFDTLTQQLHAVESLYHPASSFIAESESIKNAGLEFHAELRVLPKWNDIAQSLHGRKNGDFLDWFTDFPERVVKISWSDVEIQLRESIDRLARVKGEPRGDFRDPSTALKGSKSLDAFLSELFGLSWLEVRFGLTGNGHPLEQLSPGQRGLVLTLFYLVVDRRTTPLLLDQPEENLDNETIASKLVPAIHEAAGRRQTIVVTHNANLAIVGDADQVIHCQVKDGKFVLASGCIADIDVAKFALDILEGTKPAFDNRRHKYEAFPELV